MSVIPGVPPPPAPAAPSAPKPVGDSGTAWLKEIMIAALALITLTALLLVYCKLMRMPPAPPQGQAISDAVKAQTANVEKVGTALFGIFAAFVGYYAGRVPAERAAAASQQEAQAARNVAQQKGTEVAHATALLANARDHLLGNAVTAAAANAGGNADPAALVGAIDAFINTRRSQ